jgi:hypothetical protein
MSFVNVAIMLAVLGLAMGASMLYYGTRGKKRMREGMDRLAGSVNGTVIQQSRLHYPSLAGTVGGRPVNVFIHLSAGHRKTSDIVYLVLSTPVDLPSGTLVVQQEYFAVAPGKGGFNDVAGDFLADRIPGRYVYAEDEAATDALLAAAGVREELAAFERYPSIVLGPDAITVGKPYGGARDLLPEQIVPELEHMAELAARLGNAKPAPIAATAEA